MKKLLVGCERSGIVRDAFIKLGVNAISCDLVDTESPGPHITADLLTVLTSDEWNMLIAFPDCTYLTGSGIHWNNRGRGWEGTEAALDFFRALLNSPVPHIALENPVGIVSTKIKKPSQKIQPYEFGEDASKKTCLWLKALPPLYPTKYIEPRWVEGKPRWSNQTDSGQNKLGPSEGRAMLRAKTYQGIADAMANQWSRFLL